MERERRALQVTTLSFLLLSERRGRRRRQKAKVRYAGNRAAGNNVLDFFLDAPVQCVCVHAHTRQVGTLGDRLRWKGDIQLHLLADHCGATKNIAECPLTRSRRTIRPAREKETPFFRSKRLQHNWIFFILPSSTVGKQLRHSHHLFNRQWVGSSRSRQRALGCTQHNSMGSLLSQMAIRER